MTKQREFHPVFILAVLLGFHLVFTVHAAAGTRNTSQKRADAIVIDTLSAYGELEKSPVLFLHDTHTTALTSAEPSCRICHLKKEGALYPKFKRTENSSRKDLINLYHQGCISCHGDMRLRKEKTGPVECDDCHYKEDAIRPYQHPMGFDPSLHYRHSATLEEKCETCHHEYDEIQQKRVYIKGKEGTCRYCHKDKDIENRVSMATASHLACITCHLRIQGEAEVIPPATCRGCHDPEALEKIKTISPVPRMKQGQPDLIVVHTGSFQATGQERFNPVGFVPFNHKSHETAGYACRQCHHESFDTCGTCHPPIVPAGRDRLENQPHALPGNEIPAMEKTMHDPQSRLSCTGCHNEQKQAVSCAGCHQSIDTAGPLQDDACKKCHVIPGSPETLPTKTLPIERKPRESMAENFMSAIQPPGEPDGLDDMPGTVIIGKLADKYEAVRFPHGKIVKALLRGIEGNGLSARFHDRTSLCTGCHHNSPASEKPPACASCHAGKWNASHPERPGILGAYHQQCMGCHKAMDLQQHNTCTACHKEQ